jgi:hypothetical protein
MKYIINERQYKLITEEQEILHIPSLELFNNDWETLQKFLERRGNPLFSIGGDLDLSYNDIESLGNLTSVGGGLDLRRTNIKSLGKLTSVGGSLCLRDINIKSLGNLISVGGYLDLGLCENLTSLGNLTSVGGFIELEDCKNLTSLGNLTSVGGSLDLRYTPISKKYSKEEIKQMVDIGGDIYLSI